MDKQSHECSCMNVDEITFSVPRNHVLCGRSICIKLDGNKLEPSVMNAMQQFINSQLNYIAKYEATPVIPGHVASNYESIKKSLLSNETIFNFVDGSLYDENCELTNTNIPKHLASGSITGKTQQETLDNKRKLMDYARQMSPNFTEMAGFSMFHPTTTLREGIKLKVDLSKIPDKKDISKLGSFAHERSANVLHHE